jgi:hypothetical protein
MSIFTGNISVKDIISNKLTHRNYFWKDVLLSWAELSYKEKLHKSETDSQQLWYNSHIKVQKKVIYYKEWNEKGIKCVKDIKYETGNIMSYQEFCDKYET